MKKLLKAYDFANDSEYYEYIVDSVLNGQRKQAKELFNDMPVANRKEFVKLATSDKLELLIGQKDRDMFIDKL